LIAISLLKCTSEVNYFMFSILVPWCKCHVSIHIFEYVQFYFYTFLFHVVNYCVMWPIFGVIRKAIQLVYNTSLILVIHNCMISVRKKFGIISINFCCSFHSLILRSTTLTTIIDNN
jgi:hypothetical protein